MPLVHSGPAERRGRPVKGVMDQDDQPAWYDELMAAYVKGLDRELTALAAGAAIRDFVPCPGLRS